VAAALLDEVAHWWNDTANANPDVEVVRALRPGLGKVARLSVARRDPPRGPRKGKPTTCMRVTTAMRLARHLPRRPGADPGTQSEL